MVRQSSIYATGWRNAVELGVNPETGELWTAVYERDNLGDDIPSDYLTRVIHGGFYGWPYAYDGGIDDRVSSRPDLASRTIHVLLSGRMDPSLLATMPTSVSGVCPTADCE